MPWYFYSQVKTPPPTSISPMLAPSMMVDCQEKGSGPLPATFFVVAPVVAEVPVAMNPPAALRVEAGPSAAGTAVPVAATPLVGLTAPVAVCVTAKVVCAVVAEGIGAPRLANGTMLDFVALKFVCAMPMRLLLRSYTTYADRRKVSPNNTGRP